MSNDKHIGVGQRLVQYSGEMDKGKRNEVVGVIKVGAMK